MTQQNERNLLRVLLLSQSLVYSIDEVENDNEFWQQDIKTACKKLSALIIKKHGVHINGLFNADGGSYVADLNILTDTLMSNLCSMDLIQWGAMTELTKMVLDNPHMTLSDEEKDVMINLMREELQTAAVKIKESIEQVDKLHTKISHMKAIGNAPYQIISSELINIMRSLRKTIKDEGNEDENQPRVGTQEIS